MKFEKLRNGALLISSEADDVEMLADIKHRCGENDVLFLSELLEQTGWQGNGHLYQISPYQVGALTDAPMLTDDCQFDEDGQVSTVGDVWWFPDYMVVNFADRLLTHGRVVFAS